MSTAPKALPALHWPSFGKAMAFEGGGLVITTLLLEWTAATGDFDGEFFPWGFARLVPGFLIGWLLVTLPWMVGSYVRERDLGINYVLPAFARAVCTLLIARVLAEDGPPRQALFILSCIGGVWLIGSVGIYSLFWHEARKKGRLGDPRELPFPPEVLLFTTQISLLLVVVWIQVDPTTWEAADAITIWSMAGIWSLGALVASVFAASWRMSGRVWTAPRLLLLAFVEVVFVFLAHEPLLQGQTVGFFATVLFSGAEFGLWAVALALIPSVYVYLAVLRDPRPFAPPFHRSGWAVLTAMGAESIIVLLLAESTPVWSPFTPRQDLTSLHALLPLALAWVILRVPTILLSHRDRGMSDWVWAAICLLSSGFAPVVHDWMGGDANFLGTAYLQAAVASVIGAGLYRLDCRMRAQAGCED